MGKKREDRLELRQGTLDMMVMRTLSGGAANGHEIAKAEMAAAISRRSS
jgi:hypothetical protein